MLPAPSNSQPFPDGSWVSDRDSLRSPQGSRGRTWKPGSLYGDLTAESSFCSFRDPSTRSWPLGGRAEEGEDEEEVGSFPQPVDDYFVEPPQAEEEEEEEEKRVPPPSSHTPVMISKGEAVSLAIWGQFGVAPGSDLV